MPNADPFTMTGYEQTMPSDYDSLHESLTRAGAALALPELHGGICGALCAYGPDAALTWLDEGFAAQAGLAPQALDELRAAFHSLAAASWRDLSGEGLDFAPLLPDDAAPLKDQVQAIAAWCQGFLGGLGFAAPDLDVSPAARAVAAAAATSGDDAASGVPLDEICADFVEISRAGLSDDDLADRDAADFALAELREHVRVAVQIAFEELAARRGHAAGARDLH